MRKCLICAAMFLAPIVETCAHHLFGAHLGLEQLPQYALMHLGTIDE